MGENSTKNIESLQRFVSIVCPVYNGESFLESCIKSVLCQTYENWELLLIDDLSEDASLAVATKYAVLDKRIRVIENKVKLGAAAARNTCIGHAKGDFLAFLDSDDFWAKEKLSKQISFMIKENASFSYTQFSLVDADGNSMNRIFKVTTNKRIDYSYLLKNTEIGCSTVVLDKKKLDNKLIWFPSLKKRQDYALWVKILRHGTYAYPIQEPLTFYRIHSSSISNNKIKLISATYHVFRECEGLSVLRSSVLIFRWMINGIIKYYF